MKRNFIVVAVVGAVVGAFALGQALAQEDEESPPAGGEAAWMELGTPGPEHAEMAKTVGTWECEAKSWMEPGAEPVVEQGRCTYSMVLDGRILKQDYEGSMAGKPFTGIGYTAFDNATKKYEAIWMDSMSTGIFMMTGVKNPDGKSCDYSGSMYGPGGMEMKTRVVMRKVSDDEQVMEMYYSMPQGEVKAMELTYKRVK